MTTRPHTLKTLLLALGGVCAAATGWLVLGKRIRSMDSLSCSSEFADRRDDAADRDEEDRDQAA